MKTTLIFIIGILLYVVPCFAEGTGQQQNSATTQSAVINLVCPANMAAMATEWTKEYTKNHQGITLNLFDASDASQQMPADAIRIVAGKPDAQISAYNLIIGRQAIVPIINSTNPAVEKLYRQGITVQQLSGMLATASSRDWSKLTSTSAIPIHIYIADNEAVKTAVTGFAGIRDLAPGISFLPAGQVAAAVQKDPQAIGFCPLSELLTADKNALRQEIKILPIDKNGNGNLEEFENIYSNLADFQRGIWLGKFPKALAFNLYAVCPLQPCNDVQKEFVKWMLTDGQPLLSLNGYTELTGNESLAQIDKLTPATIATTAPAQASNTGLIILLIAGALLLGWIVTYLIAGYNRIKKSAPEMAAIPAGFTGNSLNVPAGLYFDKSHTWSFMEKNGNITVGIDDFLQQVTGPITRVELLAKGEKVKKGDVLFTMVQDGKHLSVRAPFTGIIADLNDGLKADPSALNDSPYEAGWVYRIEPVSWIKEMQTMELAAKYRTWLNDEFTRLKDFMASVLAPNSAEYAHILLHDGGELKQGLLSDFGPEVWEEFQTQFLN